MKTIIALCLLLLVLVFAGAQDQTPQYARFTDRTTATNFCWVVHTNLLADPLYAVLRPTQWCDVDSCFSGGRYQIETNLNTFLIRNPVALTRATLAFPPDQ